MNEMTQSAGDETVVVRPNRSFEDVWDGIAAVLATAVLLAAAGVLYLILSPYVQPLLLFLLLPILALAMALHAVAWMKVNAGGIQFGRRFGTPGHLPWRRIRHIRPAGRAEVILYGWLWPPFPPREATRALTSAGHYRVDWEGGFCYFPPENEAVFRAAVERWAAPGSIGWLHAPHP